MLNIKPAGGEEYVANPVGVARSPIAITDAGSSTLDAIRVLATALVFAAHISERFHTPVAISTGGLGVTLFFLLSGFLIALAAWRRWSRSGNQFGGFLLDRCARIFVPFLPALVLTVLVNALIGIQHIDNLGVNTGPLAFVGNALLLHDYPMLQAATHIFSHIRHIYPRAYNGSEPFWTIPIEFWTYVAFGIFVFNGLRRERARLLTWGLAAVAAPIFVWNSFAGGAGNLSLLWIMGATAAFLWAHSSDQSRRIWGAGALGLGVVSFAGRWATGNYRNYDMQADVSLALAMFGLFAIANSFERWPAAPRWIVKALASYSYSLYLVHNIVIMAVQARAPDWPSGSKILLTIGIANAAAIALYFCAERHYHRVGRFLKSRLLAPGAQ